MDTKLKPVLSHVCPRCDTRKRASAFRQRPKGGGWLVIHEDGTTENRESYCRKCESKRVTEYRRNNPEAREKHKEYHRRWAERNPEKVAEMAAKQRSPETHARRNELHAKRMERIKRNPRQLATYREEQRLLRWEQRRKAGVKELGPRPHKVLTPVEEHDPELPVEPFADWLDKMIAFYGDQSTFAELIDVHERQILDYKNRRRKKVRLTVVDRAVTNEGHYHLADLYPDLYPGGADVARELKAA